MISVSTPTPPDMTPPDTTPTTPPLLEVRQLSLALRSTDKRVVDGVDLSLQAGEVVGIVGESGSGKTMLARSLMRLEPPVITLAEGVIRYKGQDIQSASVKALRALRGAEIGMVFQEPMTSLNPAMRIGRQMEEGLKQHGVRDAAERRRRVLAILERVGIREPERAYQAYPHEYSGGMRQRIMLASVMLLRPSLLIADEPTTALDAVVARDVLQLMLALTREAGTTVLMISHDLPMVAHYARRVIVMEQGKIVEQGTTAQVLQAPQHPYTRKLLAAIPRRVHTRNLDGNEVLLDVQDLTLAYPGKRDFLGRVPTVVPVLHGVCLQVRKAEVVAVVGGSGSGKTTLGRVISGMLTPLSGSVRFEGQPIAPNSPGYVNYRENCQMIFQDPNSSLDPRMTIGKLVAEGLGRRHRLSGAEVRQRVAQSLEDVELPVAMQTRFAHELSGGQRQRVAIARALIRRPSFVIADEPVSALDMTIRARVLDLLGSLQEKYGFASIFISHDLAAVEQIADRVVVMHQGNIVETGTRDEIFDAPKHAYTKLLLNAVPQLVPSPNGGVRLVWRDDAQASSFVPRDAVTSTT